MIDKITIVGCGEMGSRHLQALVNLKYPLEINVVEPNPLSVEKAKQRFEEAAFERPDIKINWHRNLEKVESNPGFVINATNSKDRAELLISLMEKEFKSFLIEKIVCQSENQYKTILNAFDKYDAKGWVNLSRRYLHFIQSIKKNLNGNIVSMSVQAGNVGLGCNAIHYLDYFKYLIGNKEYWLDGSKLDKTIHPSRRGSDYVEFSGMLTAGSDAGDTLFVNFNQNYDYLPVVNINSKNFKAIIDEASGKALTANIVDDWEWKESKFEFVYQSRLTDILINDIENKKCLLPTIHESFYEHKLLLNVFIKHLSEVANKNYSFCPIT